MSDAPLWAGRFSRAPASEAFALGRSVGYDVRLAPQDVAAGIAHVGALARAGLLTDDEAARLAGALSDVGREIHDGTLRPGDDEEDVHSMVERAVTDRLGELGARLHAGRSRNDLVVTDLRLWLRETVEAIDRELAALIAVLVARAREHENDVMPGTTHGRAAQPVTLGHHLLAHAWALSRDRERFAQGRERADVSPLGAGALATSTLGLDPGPTADALGFARSFANSIDAVSDRDFVQEFVADAAICAGHVSRLAADLARWSDPAVGWATFDEAYATGSSMMPQKRNPDTAELARGKAARVSSSFSRLCAVTQGLPAGYHRDLQEDKEPAFDAADTMSLVLAAVAGALRTMRFDADAMRAACADEELYATDLAEALVRAGVPFREAHRRTGELLRATDERGHSLRDLDAAAWEAFGVPGGASLFDPDRSVAARDVPGGPGRDSVRAQIAALAAS